MVRLLAWLLSFIFLATPVLAQQQEEAQAGKTEITERGVSLKPTVFSPMQGLVTNITTIGRQDSAAATLDNLQMLKRGVWTSRGIGYTKFRSSQIITSSNLRSFLPYTDANGDPGLLIESSGTIYHLNPDAPNGTLTDLGASQDPLFPANHTTLGTFCHFTDDVFIYTSGTDKPYIWDGNLANDFADSAHWPVTIDGETYNDPLYVETFAGRAAFAGMDHPYTVLLSEYEEPEDFDVNPTPLATDAGVLTFPSALGKITGLRKLRIDNSNEEVLLVGFQKGFGMVTGTDAFSFSQVVLTNEFGLLSNRTWVQLGNELFFLATDGIRKFSTASGVSTIANASVTFGIQDLINRINRSLGKNAWAFATRHPSTQEVQFWIPVDSDESCTKAIVMNYNTASGGNLLGNSISNPIFSTRSGVTFAGGSDADNRVYYGGKGDGYLYQGYSGDTYDGTGYTWNYVSPLIGGATAIQNSSMRRVDVLTDGPSQQFTIQAYTLSQRADATTGWYLQDTRTYSVTADSITDLSTWTSGTTTTYPKFIEFQPRGSGRFWALRLTGTSSSQNISLAGINAVLHLGGWKQ